MFKTSPSIDPNVNNIQTRSRFPLLLDKFNGALVGILGVDVDEFIPEDDDDDVDDEADDDDRIVVVVISYDISLIYFYLKTIFNLEKKKQNFNQYF